MTTPDRPRKRPAKITPAERRVVSVDVQELTTQVKELRESVHELNGLIMHSLTRSEEALKTAEQKPSKSNVYLLVLFSVLVAFLLAGSGIYTAEKVRQTTHASLMTQYQVCQARNQNQEASNTYLAKIYAAVQRAQAKNDIFAVELGQLLKPVPRLELVDCGTILR